MKKIGLMTFHRPVNYGAALQAVALVKSIEMQGAECEIIDYVNPFFQESYNIFKLPKKLSLKSILWFLMMLPYEYRKSQKFRSFICKNVKLTKPIDCYENLKKIGSAYDVYVTGSDQIWNFQCSGNQTAYFLDFVVGKPKIAYAASFGDRTVSCEQQGLYRKLLHDFSKISVRETVGIDIVKSVANRDSVQTLDPTLLLTKEQWERIIHGHKPLFHKPYLLMYFMAQSEEIKREMMALAHRIARERKYHIVIIGGSVHKYKDDICYVNVESPEVFVALFRDASYIVTNSFHGTAFSVNFGKNFYSYVKSNLKIKGRVESLLEKIGLENRVFSFADKIEKINDVDYFSVASALEKERTDSINFLRGIIDAK